MCTLASPALRARLVSQTPHVYRITAHRSILPFKRHFLITPRLSNLDDPAKGGAFESNHVNEETTTPGNNPDTAQEPEGGIDNVDGSEAPSRPRDLSGYGSAARRAWRHLKKPKELPQFFLPPWFFDRNVYLREELSKLATPSKVPELQTDTIANSSPTGAADCKKAEGISPEVGKESQERNSFHQITSPVRSYSINENILREISSLIRVGLASGIGKNSETWMSSKADLLLHHPKSGGSFYLDGLVTRLAATHGADLIRLDPQDIADIGGSYVDDRGDTHVKSLSTLGFDAYAQASMRAFTKDEPHAEDASEEYDDGEGEEGDDQRNQHNSSRFGSYFVNMPIPQAEDSLMNAVRSAIATGPDVMNDQNPTARVSVYGQMLDPTYHLKIAAFFENTLNACERKREINRTVENHKSSGMEPTRAIQDVIIDVIQDPKEPTDIKSTIETLIQDPKEPTDVKSITESLIQDPKEPTDIKSTTESLIQDPKEPKDVKSTTESLIQDPKEPTDIKSTTESLILMVKDYMDIQSIPAGEKLMALLHEIVKSRRKDGQKIMIVGTSSSEDFTQGTSLASVIKMQSEPTAGPVRTILTPCHTLRSQDLTEDHHLKIALTNLRNIQDMLRRLSSHPRAIDRLGVQDAVFRIASDSRATDASRIESMETMLQRELDCKETFAKIRRYIWPLDRVHHVATIALGLNSSLETTGEDSQVSIRHIVDAIRLLSKTQAIKHKWVEDGQADGQERTKATDRPSSASSRKPFGGWSTSDGGSRIKKLRKICNTHEKRLLGGVVDPLSIRTTFADVRAPSETIDALKNLTSLSLLRPEAFTYGVLATDQIPGLLLYGPPGTGKSLLARATAKESGATVLEVSGADVYDMYVGEGEKNVKAIFSLAKKLSPCIVFIDEADAILGARTGRSNRTSHREMINQFLREWDGMAEHSAFIMVATNRPFDLDEASLRRLPRRVLVDLPTEEDREAILKIHLKDEILDHEVSLSKLASQTPFYSGSDLKNVVVAAALSCVREEVENAASSPSANPPPSITTDKVASPLPSEKAESESTNTDTSQDANPQSKRRTLAPRHFTHALEEISASISDDMGSLSAIRKFDEKFGDRRGRRKKIGGYGFETVKEGERQLSDRARVRIQN